MTSPRVAPDRLGRRILWTASVVVIVGIVGVQLLSLVPGGSVAIVAGFDQRFWTVAAWCITGVGALIFSSWAFRWLTRRGTGLADALALLLALATIAAASFGLWLAAFLFAFAGDRYVEIEADDGARFVLSTSTWHHTTYRRMERDGVFWRPVGRSVTTEDPDHSIRTGDYSLARVGVGYRLTIGPDVDGRTYRLTWGYP